MRDKSTGLILDLICPDEHTRVEGDYTIPLYTTPPASSALVEAAEFVAILFDGDETGLKFSQRHSLRKLRAAIEAEKKGQV